MSNNRKVILVLLAFGVIILGAILYGWSTNESRGNDEETLTKEMQVENKAYGENQLHEVRSEDGTMQEGWTELDNLYAFAKLYGYIKYFHPSDEASQVDWDIFAIYGVQRVLEARSEAELKEVLEEIFIPLAPTMRIYFQSDEVKDFIPQEIPLDKTTLRKVAWQHFGVGHGQPPYKSARVLLPYEGPALTLEDVVNEGQIDFSQEDQIRQWYAVTPENNMIDYKLFNDYPEIDHTVTRQISDQLVLQMPLVLLYDEQGTIGSTEETRESFQKQLNTLNELNVSVPSLNNRDVRLANIVIAWNVFQHFYPYFDVVDVSWEDILLQALSEAYEDKNKEEFLKTLKKMLEALEDGHGGVYKSVDNNQWTQLPFIVDWIEDQLIVTVSNNVDVVKPGDIIVRVNDVPVGKYLEDQERYISGSPHYKRLIAMNNLVRGQARGTIKLEIKRDEYLFEINPRYNNISSSPNIDFFDRTHTIKEVEDNIYLVNLQTVREADLDQYIKELEAAKGIIFDLRAYPDFQTIIKVIEHIITEPVMTPIFNIPLIIYPDQENKYYHDAAWEINPQDPYLNGEIVFLMYHGTASSPEVFAGIVEHYQLAEIVGQPSAGANGNINPFELLGNYNVRWTGLQVLKQDGSQHHNVGILPTVPIKRTIDAVKEGRDEYIEKAIEIIKKSAKNER